VSALLSLTLALAQAEPTFACDVAPLVHARCAGCHHPGEAAPFDLLTYRDVSRRARQILAVVESGFMPPWLPASTAHAFEGDRSLAPAERELLRRWVAAGAPEGDPAQAPPTPAFGGAGGWQLGPPDLVVRAVEPFELAADGGDVFQNLVLPTDGRTTRFVRAVALRFASRAVHHAILQVDASSGSRLRAAAEPGPGFEGMSMGSSEPPDGHFIGWTPGHVPRENPSGLAWRLPPRADLVLQVHLTPTGKPESIAPEIGLYVTDEPPERFPYSIVLYRDDIDIPAGEASYTLRDEYVLPADVEVLGVYPHAHYRGKRVRLGVERSDGTGEDLLLIEDWDFNWQDEYRYAEPFALRRGDRLVMEWTWDNSADNVRNPAVPPRRVTFGERSSDEMGTVTLNVLPLEAAGLEALKQERWRHALRKRPEDPRAHSALAALLLEGGRTDEALEHLERALRSDPGDVDALVNLGLVLRQRGEYGPALDLFRRAAERDPAQALAHVEWGRTLAAAGRPEEGLAHYRAVLAEQPELHEVRLELAVWLARAGEVEEPLEHLLQVVAARPGIAEAHNNLANLYFQEGRLDLAVEQYRRALAERPDYVNAHLNLGRALLERGVVEEGLRHLRRALELRPGDAQAEAALREALGRQAGGQR